MAKVYPDISHYETVKDWKEAKKNCPFIAHKATQRCDGDNPFVDPNLKSFVTNCEKYKIPYWLYCYLENGNEVKQTKFLVKTCKDIVGPYFIGYALDAEEKNDSDRILESLKVLKDSTDAKRMLYTGYSQYSYLKKAINNRGKDVPWWEARYNKILGPHKGCDLHQYTEKGKLAFISGEVDLNKILGSTFTEKWYTTRAAGSEEKNRVYYPGKFPILPPRGYFKKGDGISTYKSYKDDIKLVQKLVNWITGSTLTVDGEYGSKTKSAVINLQKILGVKDDGLFGKATLTASECFYK